MLLEKLRVILILKLKKWSVTLKQENNLKSKIHYLQPKTVVPKPPTTMTTTCEKYDKINRIR